MQDFELRITSACAEQTPLCPPFPGDGEDHLRVCGADRFQLADRASMRGSPPRVRSRLADGRDRPGDAVDHLRVCGADSRSATVMIRSWGSPPRVRSRPGNHANRAIPGGITSACAEQTNRFDPHLRATKDHLRVCGADVNDWNSTMRKPGSPPRVRSRRTVSSVFTAGTGITSACAEQTNME